MTNPEGRRVSAATPAALPTAWLSWSSGKDSAWALHQLRTSGDVEVTGLLTTINAADERVSMHAVRRELLEAQADAVGLPLHVVELPSPCSNDIYEAAMAAAVGEATAAGVTHFAFGDLLLADIRAYREAQLAGTGIEPIFPLWGRDTRSLPHEMFAAGLTAVATCVDMNRVPPHLAGRPFDTDFLAALPDGADPSGENGEFHTFVTDCPDFAVPVPVTPGDRVDSGGFRYVDLLPSQRR